MENIDLFEDYDNLPKALIVELEKFDEEKNGYEECAKLLKAFNELGYTFDYGLSAEPFNLMLLKDKPHFIIRLDKFKGYAETWLLEDDEKVAFSDNLSFEEYQKTLDYPIKLVSRNEMESLIDDYKKNLQTDFFEITEERYDYMLNILPPLKMSKYKGIGIFFISEAMQFDYHNCFIACNGKFYTALRSINETSESLISFLNKQ